MQSHASHANTHAHIHPSCIRAGGAQCTCLHTRQQFFSNICCENDIMQRLKLGPSLWDRYIFYSFPRSSRAFEGDVSVGTRLFGQAGSCHLMGMVIETVWWCWLLACCALLDSHFLTNLTCVAFCYLARTPCSGRVDYSLNVKEGYCLLSFLKGSRKLSDNDSFSPPWFLAK